MRAIVTLLFLVVAAPLRADVIDATNEALSLLENARASLAAVSGKRDRIRAYGKAIQGYEVAVLAARAGLRELSLARERMGTRYHEKQQNVGRLLGALQLLSRTPKELSILHPQGAVGAARASMTLADLVPRAQNEAEALAVEYERLATLTALQETTLDQLGIARADLANARAAVRVALDADRSLTAAERNEETRIAALASNARNLTELARGLSALPVRATSANADFPALRGSLEWPVTGRILRHFRERDAAGIARNGVIVGAAPLSIVRTPVSGTLVYSGAFLDLGDVAIIDPGGGFLLVLSGLGEIYARTGDQLTSGAPLGILGGTEPTDEVFLIARNDADSAFFEESLYIELRKDGIAVDPRPWFAAGGETER